MKVLLTPDRVSRLDPRLRQYQYYRVLLSVRLLGRACRSAARFPRLKFASQILAARFAQLGNDLGVLPGQPVLQFIERFDRRKHWHWDFDSVLRHSGIVSAGAL